MSGQGIEYLDPEIAGEGTHADAPIPGTWMDGTDPSAEEFQPDIEPPHVNDYAAFKKHKHYRQYFRPYRYQPFPAFMYHPTLGEKIVKSKDEVAALGPEWSPTPIKPRVDMTGKSLPVKSDTQRLAETIAATMPKGASPIDATAIAAIVAAVMAAMPQNAAPQPTATNEPVGPIAASIETIAPSLAAGETEAKPAEALPSHENLERTALLELAAKENIKIDQRWGNKRLKEALGIA